MRNSCQQFPSNHHHHHKQLGYHQQQHNTFHSHQHHRNDYHRPNVIQLTLQRWRRAFLLLSTSPSSSAAASIGTGMDNKICSNRFDGSEVKHFGDDGFRKIEKPPANTKTSTITTLLTIVISMIRLIVGGAVDIRLPLTHLSKKLKCSTSLRIAFGFLLLSIAIAESSAGCRDENPDACESICTSNPYTNPNANCTIRALVLAPNSTFYEASLPRVLPMLKLAEKRVKALQLLPPQVQFSWISRDDRCDAGYALIGAMDGIAKNCSHVIFGPSCDYPLASVGRVAKYFHSEGTPILSVGGFTYDFQIKKTDCKDEFYMLIRTGIVSFQSISELIVAVMKYYNWNHALLMYERDGQRNVAGQHTCQLMMKTLVETFKHLNVTYSPFDLDSGAKNLTEDLQNEIGTRNSSE